MDIEMSKNHKIAVASAIIGISLSMFMVYVGLKHNPMGEFCTNPGEVSCNIDLSYTFTLAAFWFLPSFVVTFCILFITTWVILKIKK
ncbi:MAG: hypothetical protein GY941_00305 [Planctomycetes bacterium]|nr:hypothetical protein [Planctomycetota bacterium]